MVSEGRRAGESCFAIQSWRELRKGPSGVPQDYVLAHMWFNLPAATSLLEDAATRERAVKYRDRVAAEMTTERIAEAQRLAREWKPTDAHSPAVMIPDQH